MRIIKKTWQGKGAGNQYAECPITVSLEAFNGTMVDTLNVSKSNLNKPAIHKKARQGKGKGPNWSRDGLKLHVIIVERKSKLDQPHDKDALEGERWRQSGEWWRREASPISSGHKWTIIQRNPIRRVPVRCLIPGPRRVNSQRGDWIEEKGGGRVVGKEGNLAKIGKKIVRLRGSCS